MRRAGTAMSSAIEMHLVSLEAQTAVVDGQSFDFELGESIHTETSRKYDVRALFRAGRERRLVYRRDVDRRAPVLRSIRPRLAVLPDDAGPRRLNSSAPPFNKKATTTTSTMSPIGPMPHPAPMPQYKPPPPPKSSSRIMSSNTMSMDFSSDCFTKIAYRLTPQHSHQGSSRGGDISGQKTQRS